MFISTHIYTYMQLKSQNGHTRKKTSAKEFYAWLRQKSYEACQYRENVMKADQNIFCQINGNIWGPDTSADLIVAYSYHPPLCDSFLSER